MAIVNSREKLAGLPKWPQRRANHKGADGSRERKWKITQAKRLVKKAAASEKNLVLRETARQRDESQQIRRRASWVAKEVMQLQRRRLLAAVHHACLSHVQPWQCRGDDSTAQVQVMKFWAKAERVVNFKVKSVAEARKKEVMDKHLSFLVDQTQRYSSLLAERLHTGAALCARRPSSLCYCMCSVPPTSPAPAAVIVVHHLPR